LAVCRDGPPKDLDAGKHSWRRLKSVSAAKQVDDALQ
jgi:hypothetical protein